MGIYKRAARINNTQGCLPYFKIGVSFAILDNRKQRRFSRRELKTFQVDGPGGLALEKYLSYQQLKEAVGDEKGVAFVIDFTTFVYKTTKESHLTTLHTAATMDLVSRMKDLFKSGKQSDFSVNIGTEVIAVHKAILASGSPVFAAMLDTDFFETTQNSLTIEDFSAGAFREFLSYLYCRQCENISKYPMELMKLAEKYQTPVLKVKINYFKKCRTRIRYDYYY